jgi:hypothetical protein
MASGCVNAPHNHALLSSYDRHPFREARQQFVLDALDGELDHAGHALPWW